MRHTWITGATCERERARGLEPSARGAAPRGGEAVTDLNTPVVDFSRAAEMRGPRASRLSFASSLAPHERTNTLPGHGWVAGKPMVSQDENAHILVVDDDADVRYMLRRYLERHGYRVDTVEDGGRMRELMQRQRFDLIVLDLSLPGEDGLSLARYLREHYTVGIIMLTAAAEVVDRIIGLETGADDYVTKPFEPRELLARIKSVLRRMQATGPAAGAPGSERRVAFGRCVLDLDSHRLYGDDGEEVAITSMEFDLLKAFAENPNKALSRDRLLDLAHHRNWDPYDRSIDIRVARLRKKIERDASKPQAIKTVRGAGYMFVPGDTH